jgi:hypothetical protein
MSKQDLINQYFKVFKLDNRASKEELEIAYEVLTKGANLSNAEIQGYRLAFEYLMTNFYSKQPEKEEIIDLNEEYFDEEITTCIATIPKPIRDAITFVENKLDMTLADATKIIWSTQNINLPMFFKQIDLNKKSFLGINWWTKKDIKNILNQSAFNPLEYITTIFEFSEPSVTTKYTNVVSFVKKINELFSKDKYLCPRFDTKVTKNGIIGFVVIEKALNEQLVIMLQTKAKQHNIYLNLVTQRDESENIDEL